MIKTIPATGVTIMVKANLFRITTTMADPNKTTTIKITRGMTTMTIDGHRGIAIGALALLACTGTGIGSDLARVRELTDTRRLADVTMTPVDPAPTEEISKMVREPMDADTAVRVAVLNNRELRATLREMGIARGQLVQAGLLPNPVVEAELLPEQNSDLSLRVEYNLAHTLMTPLRTRVARAELEGARLRAAGQVVAVGYQVRSAFYGAQSAEQQLQIARRTLDVLAAARDAARALLEAGNIPELEAVTHEAVFERARILVARLELDVAARRERVNRLLGLHGPDTGWRLRGEMLPVSDHVQMPSELENTALEKNFELAETRSRLEALARRTGLTRAQGWLPELLLDVHALKAESAFVAQDPTRDEWRFGAGVALSVPLFDRKQGQTAALTAEFDSLLERYYGAAIDVRSAAREIWARVMSTHARARQYQDVILPAQRRLTEQTLLQYNAMQVGVFQLLVARREELDAELAYVETLREHWTAVAALNTLMSGRRPAITETASATIGFGVMDAVSGGH